MNYALLAALKESASTRRGKAEAKELPFVSTFLFSSGEEGGYYLRSVAPSSPKPSPTPLHVRCCCTTCRFIWHCRAANLNLTFSRCRSRRLNLSKRSRGEVFLRLDAADLKFCDGSYLVGSDRAKFQIQKSINQKDEPKS